MRAAMCMLVRTDYEKGTWYKGERTSCVFPPRDVNELLDVADLLRLYKTCYERLETRRMSGRHLPWRGASFEGNIIPMSTASTVADRAVQQNSESAVPISRRSLLSQAGYLVHPSISSPMRVRLMFLLQWPEHSPLNPQ
jgi:hypothetical protein